MKIIKQGSLKALDKFPQKCNCSKCSTEFVFNKDDITYGKNNGEFPALGLNCPLCGDWIDPDRGQFSELLKEEIIGKYNDEHSLGNIFRSIFPKKCKT